MNEEEIKAIEYLKFKIKDFEENYGVGITTKQIENFKTVLNLIEKQQAEIVKANKQKHNQSSLRRLNERKMRKYRTENKELKTEIETLKRDFEIVDHECSRLEQEDIRKDKVINEMAKWIHDKGTDETEICDYEKCIKYTTRKKIFGDCIMCIKEYFTNKAENVGE